MAEATQQSTRREPVAPIFVFGRDDQFLDVRPSVDEAARHLLEHADEKKSLDDFDYADALGRHLDARIGDAGGVELSVGSGIRRQRQLRRRVNRCLLAALDAPQASEAPAGLLDPIPARASHDEFLDTMQQRFRYRGAKEHSGGYLHNFWHALGG